MVHQHRNLKHLLLVILLQASSTSTSGGGQLQQVYYTTSGNSYNSSNCSDRSGGDFKLYWLTRTGYGSDIAIGEMDSQ